LFRVITPAGARKKRQSKYKEIRNFEFYL